MTDLDTVLADLRGEAAVLRRAGHREQADAYERFASLVADATEDFRTFLTEPQAALRSGKSQAWLRSRFAGWLADGNARHGTRRGERLYRALVVPRRPNIEAALEAGRRAGRMAS